MKANKSSTICHLVAESFSAFLDRSLPASVELDIARHLEDCPECFHRLESMKSLIVDLRQLDTVEAASELAWSVKREVRRFARKEETRPLLRPFPFLASAATAAILLVIVSIQGGPEESSIDRTGSQSAYPQMAESTRLERYVLPTQVGEDNVPGLFEQQAAVEDTSNIREPSRIRGARAVRF